MSLISSFSEQATMNTVTANVRMSETFISIRLPNILIPSNNIYRININSGLTEFSKYTNKKFLTKQKLIFFLKPIQITVSKFNKMINHNIKGQYNDAPLPILRHPAGSLRLHWYRDPELGLLSDPQQSLCYDLDYLKIHQ